MCNRQEKLEFIDRDTRLAYGFKDLMPFINREFNVTLYGEKYKGNLIEVLTDAHIVIPGAKYWLLVVFKIARALRNRKYNSKNPYNHMKNWSVSRVIKYYAEKKDTYFIYDNEYHTVGTFAFDYDFKVNSVQQYRSNYKYIEGGWIFKIFNSGQKDKMPNRVFFIPDENGDLIQVSLKDKLKYLGYDLDIETRNRISANISVMKDDRSDEEKLEQAIKIVLNNGKILDSYLEDSVYKILVKRFGKKNVKVHYNSDPRYPYKCDFYIVPFDLFIEVNGHWSHGIKPYDKNDPDCVRILKEWQEKAKNSNYYKGAIETWTKKDVEKRNTAKKNGLNYKEFYGSSIINDVIEFLQSL